MILISVGRESGTQSVCNGSNLKDLIRSQNQFKELTHVNKSFGVVLKFLKDFLQILLAMLLLQWECNSAVEFGF